MTTIVTNASTQELLELGAEPSEEVQVLTVTELVTRDASITEIVAKIQNDIVVVTGTARRSPGDKPNDRIGKMLATARAYAALAKRIERRARGLVEHHADIQVQRPIQKIKSNQWKQNILRIASTDDGIQKAALRAQREREGSWVANSDPAQLQAVDNTRVSSGRLENGRRDA